MYIWNGLKIYIDGTNPEFISAIKNFFYGSYAEFPRDESDIVFSIHDVLENKLPPVGSGAKLIKSRSIIVESEFGLEVYEHEEKLWYMYQDIAGICIDFKNNKIILSLSGKLFPFIYYNILLFFLYPLGMLLENLGYFRVHASCVNTGEKTVLFTGQSGSGKSTAAFASAAGGGSIISDDVTFLKRSGTSYNVHTITRLVKLHGDTINRFFPELMDHKYLKSNEGEIYFDSADINKRKPENSTLDGIIILERTDTKYSSMKRIHPLKVIPHLFPSTLPINNSRFTQRKFNFLSDLLNEVHCYNVGFGTDMADFYDKIINPANEDTL